MCTSVSVSVHLLERYSTLVCKILITLFHFVFECNYLFTLVRIIYALYTHFLVVICGGLSADLIRAETVYGTCIFVQNISLCYSKVRAVVSPLFNFSRGLCVFCEEYSLSLCCDFVVILIVWANERISFLVLYSYNLTTYFRAPGYAGVVAFLPIIPKIAFCENLFIYFVNLFG